MATATTRLNHVWTAARGNAVGLVRSNFWGLADHGLISGSNFVTMVLLARGLGEARFGEFTLVYTALLFANSFQDSLIAQPHNVIGPTKRGLSYVRYTTSTAAAQLLLVVVGGVLALLAGMAALAVHWSGAPLLFALAVAVVGWQLQEFMRRVMYTEGRLGAAFSNDLISYGGQAVVIAYLWWEHHLSGPAALVVVAVTSIAAAALGAWQIRHSLGREIERAVLKENWDFGKWLGGGELGRWLSVEAYLYLSALLLGSAAAGMLKAAQVLFGPLRILMLFLYTVLPTRLSRALTTKGDAALRSQVMRAYATVVPVLFGYCLLMAIFARPILGLMYGQAYTNITWVVVLFATYAFIGHAGQLISTALRARQQARPIFMGQMASALVTIPAGWALIRVLGVDGAVVSMIGTQMIVNVVFWHAFLRRSAGADGEASRLGVQPLLSAPVSEPKQHRAVATIPIRQLRPRVAGAGSLRRTTDTIEIGRGSQHG